jgi:hypothetical protein
MTAVVGIPQDDSQGGFAQGVRQGPINARILIVHRMQTRHSG